MFSDIQTFENTLSAVSVSCLYDCFQILKPLWSCQMVSMELIWGMCAQKQVRWCPSLVVVWAQTDSPHVARVCSQGYLPSALTASTWLRRTSWRPWGRWQIQRSSSPSWTTNLFSLLLSHYFYCHGFAVLRFVRNGIRNPSTFQMPTVTYMTCCFHSLVWPQCLHITETLCGPTKHLYKTTSCPEIQLLKQFFV